VTSTTVSTNHDHGFLRHDHGSDTSTVFFRSRSRPFSDPRPRLLSLRATKHEHESPSPGFFSKLSNIGLQSLSGLLTLVNSREKVPGGKILRGKTTERIADVSGTIANLGLICTSTLIEVGRQAGDVILLSKQGLD